MAHVDVYICIYINIFISMYNFVWKFQMGSVPHVSLTCPLHTPRLPI